MQEIRISPFGSAMWQTIGWHMLVRDEEARPAHFMMIIASMLYRINRLELEAHAPFGMSINLDGMMDAYDTT